MKYTRILFLFTLLCAALASLQAVHANIITVANTADSGPGSLRQALADANDVDTIDFDSSLRGQTITLTSGQLLVRNSLTISGPGAANLAVNGNAASRVFLLLSGQTVTISGLTITNGQASPSSGGGIYNDHSTLTVSSCTISGNSAFDGGGIYNNGFSNGSATLTVSNCTISGNSASYGGGGIFNDGNYGSATLEVLSSTLSSNSAPDGGDIFNNGTYGSATVGVTNSTLSSNSVPEGGGIYNIGYSGSATLEILNSTLNGNWPYYSGGGIENYFATTQLGSNIFNASDIINYSGTITSLGYNLSSDAAGGDGTTGPGGLLNATGDIRNMDPMLGPLQDNGGPTFTHELLSRSPAIDAGDPNFDPPPDNDQRGPGFSRVVNGRIDIGAFEAQTVTPSYAGQIQAPINADGTSIFSVRRGVVPVKFTLTQGGIATCDLPPATIAVTRTGGGVIGGVNESLYSGNADAGSNFRIDNCQYLYNLNSRALGVGIYRVEILINGQPVGSAVFQLQ